MTKLEYLELIKNNSELSYNTELDEDNWEEYFNTDVYKGNGIEYDIGATKIVFFERNSDFVIKVPFCGAEGNNYYTRTLEDNCYTYRWDGERTIHKSYSEYEFIPFSGANCENGWDYCAAEVNAYEKAKKAGIEYLFAKTEFLGDVCGYPIYSQEKATMYDFYTSTSERTKESLDMANEKIIGRCPFRSITWIADFISYYNEALFDELCDFLAENNINDMHSGNIGYIGDVPVLVDYAGYHS